jgi:hypothetical protein
MDRVWSKPASSHSADRADVTLGSFGRGGSANRNEQAVAARSDRVFRQRRRAGLVSSVLEASGDGDLTVKGPKAAELPSAPTSTPCTRANCQRLIERALSP